jgi:hypothetical protein
VCVRIPCSYGDPARIHYYSAVVVVPAINVLDERQRVISRHRNWDGDQQSVWGARLRNKAAELADRARAMRISSSRGSLRSVRLTRSKDALSRAVFCIRNGWHVVFLDSFSLAAHSRPRSKGTLI